MCDGQGACVGCLTASDCRAPTPPASTRTCTSGQCGVSNTAAGTALPAADRRATARRSSATARVRVVTVADDTDKPVDGNACTQDLCSGGLPSNPPETAGTTCAQSGGSRCNGSGRLRAVPAGRPTARAPTPSATSAPARAASAASTTPPSGTASSARQTAGDCKKNVCNGSGSVITAIDDTDIPVDGNACTQDVCTNGTPSNPPQPANTACNAERRHALQRQQLGAGLRAVPAGHRLQRHRHRVPRPHLQRSRRLRRQQHRRGHRRRQPDRGRLQEERLQRQRRRRRRDRRHRPARRRQRCTSDVCTTGVASNPPVTPGTTCNQNGGSLCDATGSLRAVPHRQRPAPAARHRLPHPHLHERRLRRRLQPPTNTVVASQTAGDCKKSVCDGTGNVISIRTTPTRRPT